MSYLIKSEYYVVPEKSYEIIRNCAKCDCKMSYENTKRFRVNANGNRIDVWLIYQCKKCKHTYNLSIYERVAPSVVEEKEYEAFLRNDEELALEYGRKKKLFLANRAVIDEKSVTYELIAKGDENKSEFQIFIPDHMKIRVEKVLSEIFQLSRSKVNQFICNEKIIVRYTNNKEIKVWYQPEIIT